MTSSTPPPFVEGSHRITRVAKACEPCRRRKTKCDITKHLPCSECVKRSMDVQCVQRVQARRRGKQARVVSPDAGRHAESPISCPEGSAPHLRDDNLGCEQLNVGHAGDSAAFLLRPAEDRESYRGRQGLLPPLVGQDLHVLQSAGSRHTDNSPSNTTTSSILTELSLTRERIERKVGRKYGANRVEDLLYSLLHDHCPDLEVDFGLPTERLIDLDTSSLSLDAIGLQKGSPDSLANARHWIDLHFNAVHHNTPFLHRPTVENIARRYLGPSAGDDRSAVEPDERALLFSVLALGSFREQTWDADRGSYKELVFSSITNPSAQPLHATSHAASALLFDLAQRNLNNVDSPSELAVQALFMLHTYASNTSLGRWSRDFVARAVMMSHELGLNRRIPLGFDRKKRQTTDVAVRRAILYLYILFADVYLAALDSHPPLIKTSDYDPSVFDPILFPPTSAGTATPPTSSTAGLSAFVDLVRTSGEVLEGSLEPPLGAPSPTDVLHLLQMEQKLDQLRDRLGVKTFSIRFDGKGRIAVEGRAVLAGRLLRQIHYNWIRIAVREPYLISSLLSHSSLAVCARSALSILSHYRHVLSAGLLNLPWMQLRRIATSIELVFIAHIKGELLTQETESAISDALVLFTVLGTRWKLANRLADAVRQTVAALGLNAPPRASNLSHQEWTTELNAQASNQTSIEQTLLLGDILPILPSDNTLTSLPQANHSSMQPSLSDPFLDNLSSWWRQGTPPSIDMMDGFGAWIVSSGLAETSGTPVTQNLVDNVTGDELWD